VSTVPGAASAFDRAFLREFIDQQHHSAGKDAQKAGETLLIRPRNSRDEPKNSGVRRCDSQMRDSGGEPISGMRAELSEQKSRASWALGPGTHGLAEI
jgi:hypothetical protein